MNNTNNASSAAAVIEYKQVQLNQFTLASGASLTTNLPSQMIWSGMQFDLAGTLNVSVATPVQALDGILNLIQTITLNVNGRPIFNLPFADAVYRSWIQQGCKQIFNDPGTATGDFYVTLKIFFNLPFPATSPGAFGTVLPAALLNNIQLQVQCPSSLSGANFSNLNGATVTYSNGPTLTVSAIAGDVDRQTMLNIVNAGGHGYVQNRYIQPVLSSGDLDLDLQGGSGIMKDFYCRTINNSVAVLPAAAPFASNVRLMVGNNLFPVDSYWMTLRNQTPQTFRISQADMPAGAYLYTANKHGNFLEGFDLRRQPSVKLRTTITVAPTATAQQNVITGILVPDYIKSIM